MINRAALANISDTLIRLGEQPKRNRSKCPVHRGDNPEALSFDDKVGHWYCHRCGKGGDVIELIKLALDTDFKGALRFLGIEPGKPPRPDPQLIRQARMCEDLHLVVKTKAREFRNQYCNRWEFWRQAMELLNVDHENSIGWELLRRAYFNEARDEYTLGQIDMSKMDEDFTRALNYLMQMDGVSDG